MSRRHDIPRRPAWSSAAALLLVLPMQAWCQAPAEQASATDSGQEGWTWIAAPYLWATSVKTNLREDAPPAGGDSDFSDIISKIDMALQLHVEGQGQRFGAFGDLTYLSLGDEATHANSSSESSLDVAIIELAGVWNLSPEHYEGWDIFAGIRHLGTEASVRIDPVNPAIPSFEPSIDVGLTDFMLGARYNATFSDRWGATFRLDGSTGETDGTINASALLRYKVSKGSWVLGYRYMEVELGEGDRSLDLTMDGPVVAFSFGF